MKVQDIMVREVVTVTPDTLLMEVADLLHSNDVSGLPVVNQEGIVQGLITEAELFSKDRKFYLPMYAWLIQQTDFVLGAKEGLPYEAGRITRVTAKELMNRNVFFAQADMEIEKLNAKIGVLDQNPIPVTDNQNKLLGVVSKGDLLRHLSGVDGKREKVTKDRYVDDEFNYVAGHMSNKFAFIAKARANVWLVAATVLFIIGFIAGVVYVVNPRIFNFEGGRVRIEAPQP